MIEADAFLDAAAARGTRFYTGVPCSYLTPLINRVASRRGTPYVGAASEGEAVAIAAGAWLGGHGTAVMMQNSGLGNAVNPLTSLNHPFRIPTLLVVTWRGEPGHPDEPQHALMGRITGALLDTIEVPHGTFPQTGADIAPALDAAAAAMSAGRPYALVMHQGSVQEGGLDEPPRLPIPPGSRTDLLAHGARPTRAALLDRLLAALPPDAAVVATTGKCGRELFTLADREQHLYQVGSMGCASGMGLGVALATGRRTVVLDGGWRGADEAGHDGHHRRAAAGGAAACPAGQRRARQHRRPGHGVARAWSSATWRWPAATARPGPATMRRASTRRCVRRCRSLARC